MATKRILTGIRPTGPLHLGHFAGALSMWVDLQENYECFFLVADIQALTTHADQPALIEESVREVLLDLIAVGLDPTRSNVHFVLQSALPELTELTVYFSMLASFAEVERNPTVKAEMANLESGPTLGFISYPVSQAADILLFTPYPAKEGDELLVPVGEDQVPHLEETNRIARRFNDRYGRVFLECRAKTTTKATSRLVGTDGAEKMSKSLENAIFLRDDAEIVEKKVAGMFTDPEKLRHGDPGRPETCPVYLYHEAFGQHKEPPSVGHLAPDLYERRAKCKGGLLDCVECKKDLAKVLNEFLDPIRIRRKEAESKPLGEYLRNGTEEARKLARATLSTVRKAMHLDYPHLF